MSAASANVQRRPKGPSYLNSSRYVVGPSFNDADRVGIVIDDKDMAAALRGRSDLDAGDEAEGAPLLSAAWP